MKCINNESVMGVPSVWFVAMFTIVMAGIYTGQIPDNLMGGFAICMTLGSAFYWIGGRIPVIKEYGGGSLFAVLLPALMASIGLLPEDTITICKNFFSGYDFSAFLVSSFLVGGVLAMDRKLLINAGIRLVIPMIGTIILVSVVVGCLGTLFDYGFIEAILYITGPIFAAGFSAVVPLSRIYAGYSGETADSFFATLTSAVMISNIITIIFASLLTSIGRKYPYLFNGFYGEKSGHVLRIHTGHETSAKSPEHSIDTTSSKDITSYTTLNSGFLITLGFYAFGLLCTKFIPFLDVYLFMSILAIILKIAGVFPASMCSAVGSWTKFVSKTFIPCSLTAISLSSPNLFEVFADPKFVSLVFLTILTTVVISGVLSWLFGFYFVEGSIMVGLGLADMGSSGDIAVAGAAKRLDLLPFLTVSTRIGCYLNLLWMTLLASRFV